MTAHSVIQVKVDDVKGLKETKLLRLAGDLETEAIEIIRETAYPLLESGVKRLIFDCRDLEYVTSPALGILINIYKKARTIGGDARFFGLKKNIYEVFVKVGLTKAFRIFPSEEKAIKSFKEE